MGKNHRSERLAEEIRKVVSEMLIKGDLKDPRFQGMISVSGVDISSDGSYATLYITALSYNPSVAITPEEKQSILDAFNHSSGYIRSQIDKAVKVRYVPELSYKFDESYEYGAKMDKLLDSLK
ncbi:MAG: 30S ribosome-binding factor RbfA [Bacillota bacterium]|nr:30S ribosome-binding factor RbfA [Bacillota bacterium]